jgi:hypothetical protein
MDQSTENNTRGNQTWDIERSKLQKPKPTPMDQPQVGFVPSLLPLLHFVTPQFSKAKSMHFFFKQQRLWYKTFMITLKLN